jgi:polyvinyl alcohol dehydrogenase (cytochrome)
MLHRIDRATGARVWSRRIADLTGIPGNLSRTTPVIAGTTLVLGDHGGNFREGARMIAVDKTSGELLWSRQVDAHPSSVIAQSAVAHEGRVYVGVSSLEELHAALVPGYPCCGFRGSVLALDAGTGATLWQTFTTPGAGYSGNAVWGSTPVIDIRRGSIYVTTGNNYTVPSTVADCVKAAAKAEPRDPAALRVCVEEGNYFDAVVALDLESGVPKWARSMVPFDAWTIACIFGLFNPGNCPSAHGVDHDFGQGPALFEVEVSPGERRELLGIGQKSGMYWALDPDNGDIVWQTKVGPGGFNSGLMWGSATDAVRIYTANVSGGPENWELVENGAATNEFARNGFWSALDATTGTILWQRPDPSGARAEGPVTTANGIVFAGSMARGRGQATMFALDAATGDLLWSFVSGGTVNSGPAIVDGVVYWGSGYPVSKNGTWNNALFAFALGTPRRAERRPAK